MTSLSQKSTVNQKLTSHAGDRFLDLVTLQGKLKLRNFEKETANIIIVVSVQGKPISASDNGVVQADPTKLRLVERVGSVRWGIKLKKGATKTLTYKYERYVPSD